MKCNFCDKEAEFSTHYHRHIPTYALTCKQHNNQLTDKLKKNNISYRNGKPCLFCRGVGQKICCDYKGIRI